METREQQYEQFLKEIADKGHFTVEEVHEFKDLRVGFDHGWDAALANQWRDVEDKLPNKKGVYLATPLNQPAEILYWNGSNWLSDEGKVRRVTHWMHIPDVHLDK